MLEGYCFPRSAMPGEPIPLHVSTDEPRFDVEVAREGAVREVVWRASGVPGAVQHVPDDAAAAGCGWLSSLEIPVGEGWRSGCYVVTLSAGDERADAFFVVRPAPGGPRAPMILVLSTTTWNAYNDWGGPSLYTGGTQVSFERPLARGFLDKPEPMRRKMQPEPDRESLWYFDWAEPLGLSVWSGGAGWATWERGFVRWAETNRYELDVAISEDLEQHPEVLDGHRLFLSVGHDEYWSRGMRETLDAFTDAGGNAAIFSGNTCFWQVRFDEDHRAMTCFKYRADEDPVVGTAEERFVTGPWSDRRIAWPETRTIGLTFTRGGYSRYGLGVPRGSGAYTVWRPDHWAFEGTDLRYGDELGRADAIVAYEVDGVELATGTDGLPVPTGADGAPDGLEILATAPARLWSQHEQPSRYAHEPGELENTAMAVFGPGWRDQVHRVTNNHACIGVFTKPGGGTVFNAGVTDWTCGLGDPDVALVTRNVLDRLSADATPPS
ncbi:MAG TPA: N,N-dimethylformamidase beta subunit family domain-containing protein [Actinomycetota bacterium]|nr:N,N-dimethylformamidase beta subunit family domain-containing protein [Actinomycetota bacterium]